MRISDRYIGKQILLGTLYAVLILSVVLVLGNLFKKIQPLLVDQRAPLELVLRFVLSVLPVSLMYTVPWGFLSAVLLVFGRLSAGNELTAFRVAGVSLVRLAVPVFVIGTLLSAASLWLNTRVVPQSKATAAQLIYDQAARDPDSLLKPGVVQGNFKGGSSGIQKVLIEGRGGEWVEGFHYHQIAGDGSGERSYVHAARAALAVDHENSQLRIKLEDAFFESHRENGQVDLAFAGMAEPLLIDLRDPGSRRKRPGSMTNAEIHELMADETDRERRIRYHTELVKRQSFSMACLAFAFIAVPLGLNARRRESSGGLMLSLLIGTGYFLVTVLARQFPSEAMASAVLWSPNAACVLLGLLLFRRARFR
jgi:lipopolysaccharide export LptBFGC system permease protein LptF